MRNIIDMAREAKEASRRLVFISTPLKNSALRLMASAIKRNKQRILSSNALDIQQAKKKKYKSSFIDRLRLDEERIEDMVSSMEEVMKHNTEDDGWTVIDGKVFDITDYLKYHPGGAKILKTALGKDCTALFRKYHAWVNYEMLLEKYVVGSILSPHELF